MSCGNGFCNSGVGKAVTVRAAQGAGDVGAQIYRTLHLFFGGGVFGLDFVRMTEGNVMDPSYEIWQQFRQL